MQFSESKTMGDCRLRWENHLHPSIYRGPWSKEEEKRLVKVANQRQCTDWKAIAEEVGVSGQSWSVYMYTVDHEIFINISSMTFSDEN